MNEGVGGDFELRNCFFSCPHCASYTKGRALGPLTCMALYCQGSEPCENRRNFGAALSQNLKKGEKINKTWGWMIRRMKDGLG